MTDNTDKKNIAWFTKFNKSADYNKFSKNPVAYFCAEFALIDDMPSYAGGLGILAGDYALEVTDRSFPLIGISLYYNIGQNSHNLKGESNATKFSLKAVKDSDNKSNLLINIPIGDKDVLAQVWLWKKKNNPVYFLDTNIPENNEYDRKITEQLYVEDRELRLRQELVLGIGGVRLLKKLNISPCVYHLNEGHSAFLIMQLIGDEMKKNSDFDQACTIVKNKVVFTNHTLVLEGQEMFAFDSLTYATKKLCIELNLNIQNIISKGKSKQSDTLFSMTTFALNNALLTNAVSRIHGEKARELWPGYPITHITNGIFLPRWGKTKTANIISDHKKNEQKLLKLIQKVRGEKWKKESLLLGWSRRFVPYKRPLALLDDVKRLKKILNHFKNKIHIVYSAPLDEKAAEANEFLKRLYTLMNGELKGYVTFIPHYRIDIAKVITAGCDVWLNTPIVGREACGTSGMKASLNGVLSLSTNDGWINEVSLNNFGWEINDADITNSILDTINNKIMPIYENFQESNNSKWKNKMEYAKAMIINDFSTTRMLREYIEKLYLPIILKKNE